MTRRWMSLLVGCAAVAAMAAAPDDHAGCPMHAEHLAAGEAAGMHESGAMAGHDHAGVAARGDQVMGFAHDKTTHHFLLTAEGGAIEVTANDPADSASRDQIQHHLGDITGRFARGDFGAPGQIHDRVLPGVPEMTRLKDQIHYTFEPTDRGGRVRIASADTEAVTAIHAFLRAQIEDHQTGDPLAPPAGS